MIVLLALLDIVLEFDRGIGGELGQLGRIIEDSDEEQEETAVGYHGEILHEPETIDKLVRKAGRYLRGKNGSKQDHNSDTSSVDRSNHSYRSTNSYRSNHSHKQPSKPATAAAEVTTQKGTQQQLQGRGIAEEEGDV